ncbi:putative Zn-dependent peptidase [Sphingomonas insulae]|uniref:Pitrilysin family protein n=1 Tax=Sphingomonas insulae TaxID=424800 RepID=A0ABN1HLD5_9SPHN|nr:pitrilysin family protein [Sphingomonas insulae]NIJ30257.1 putative Zn-dependent peptidase [Sphingomonas insulae]
MTKLLALAGVASIALVAPLHAQTTRPVPVKAAPVAALVKAVDIPYQQFTLANGLRVVVHTDRKAPVVAVSVWYDVGSKHEPKGSTGFAHLFEHLMFNGSENAPGDFFAPLKQVGATDFNGTTYFDRTNYFETVPTAALSRALFLESDRMGYLLGAITQGVLDEQRGVVQNEKRQGDNQPYGLVGYAVTEGLFPATHPYGHDTIGSMADLDAASLDTVKTWFRSHYGPNNAVLVLAGDVDVASARPLVEKYFGPIKAGPKSELPAAPVVTLPAAQTVTLKDRVAATMVSRNWAVPGLNDKDAAPLEVAAGVLGGMASSRFTNELVRKEKLFTQVSADNSAFAQVGTFSITGLVRPGVDAALAAKRLDEVTAEFLRTGPTADEVSRFVTTRVAGRVRGLEAVGGFGGKAVALAEGALYSNDPGFYKKQLADLAAQTPASVKAAADTWLARPVLAVNVVAGAREGYQEAQVPPKKDVTAAPEQAVKGTRGAIPAVGPVTALTFPKVERSRLANGIELVYARRSAVPVTQAVLSFDAGYAADVAGRLGTQQTALMMLDEGTEHYDVNALAEARERLGMQLSANNSNDRSTLSMGVPSANLGGALDLFAEVARRPAYADAEVARFKAQQVAQIQQELTNPNALAQRMATRILAAGSPYEKAQGSGDPVAVAGLTPADLRAFQQAWFRPEKAKIFVVSDRPLAEVKAALDARFGDWKGMGAAGTKTFGGAPAALKPAIVLVDRPDSPQSIVIGGQRTGLKGTDDLLVLNTVNDALGGSFLSRINMDLREEKHWSYGAGGRFQASEFAAPYLMSAGVQADKTGPSLASARDDIAQFVTTRPMTETEFGLAINGAMLQLPGQFETSQAVLGAMQANDLFKRPDDYYATITTRYRAMTLPELRTAVARTIDPARMTWVVVGDAAKVKPQLDTLGLPVEVVPASAVAGGAATAAK